MKFQYILFTLLLPLTLAAQTKTPGCDSTFKDTDGVLIHTCPDKMPHFNKDDDRYFYVNFIRKNLVYPQAAKNAGTSGRVKLEVIVTEKGILKSPRLVEGLKGIGAADCNAEAIRLVGLLPKMKPAIIDGKPIRFLMKLSVPFKKDVEEIQITTLGDFHDKDVAAPPPPPPSPVEPDYTKPGNNTDITIDTPAERTYTDTGVFVFVEVMPKFPGGETAMMEFIKRNMKFPDRAKNAGVDGTVYINFIVERDGSLSNIKLLRSIAGPFSKDFNAETIRIISIMPKWIPGTQNGLKVRVSYNLPVKFKIE